MAKKSRTPPPPRRVQAPKKRTEPRRKAPANRRKLLAVAAAAALVVAAAGGIAYAVSRGGGASEAGPCVRQTFKAQGQSHVPPAELPKNFEYNSYPPTSGPHHPQPLVWGEYTDPVPQNQLVHNLEHGGLAVQYGKDVSAATVEELTAWYRSTDPRGIILAPLLDNEKAAPLAKKIVLGAWTAERQNADDPSSEISKQEGHLATCSAFDEDAFDDFVDDYRAKGPELFPLEQLEPGSP
ncbi:MAG: DUF3105 domain-containing protein [Actinomycetota bacterium]|nr:DUF3105 domain-containing protein [Actinomycetota bacterium]